MAKAFPPRTPAGEMVRHRRAWLLGPNHFRVFGRGGDPYDVLVAPDGAASCNCPAGGLCWHLIPPLRRAIREPWTVAPELGRQLALELIADDLETEGAA